MSTSLPVTVDDETTGTRARILERLKLQGALRVDDIAASLSLSKSTVRAHLLRLEESQLIQRHFIPTVGPGRPALAFELSAQGHAQFPNDDGSVLTELLNFLKEQSEESLIKQYFSSLWTQRERELEAIAGNRLENLTLDKRKEATLELLHRHGFMPELIPDATSTDGSQFVVRECHCPFPAAVRATRIPCRLERAFLAKALGVPVRSMELAEEPGEGHCDFFFAAATP